MEEKKERFGWKIEKIIKKGDYLYCIIWEHPNATKNGYVLLHRAVMENHLGRLLDSSEVVHHKNGNKKDNRIENLEVLSCSEHTKRHQKDVGRMWVSLKCPCCGKVFEREKRKTHIQKGGSYSCCSRSCRGSFSRKVQLYGLTPSMKSAISGNIVKEYRKYSSDNPEETKIMGSVETIRTQAETA